MSFATTARIALVSLGFALFAITAPLADDGEEGFNPTQKKAVEEIVRQYLSDHPEVVLQALQAMQEKERVAEQKKREHTLFLRRSALERDPSSPVGGNPEGDVTIVEFFDYKCGYCKRVWASIRELLESDADIRYVFKEFPILGPESVAASRAALAAWKQGPKQYMALHTALMDNRGSLAETKIMAIAAEAGLDVDRLRDDMNDPSVDLALRKNYRLAQELEISGTPAFIIGDHLIPGAADLDSLRKLVAASRGN
jgi:protein-disulfide isomerase